MEEKIGILHPGKMGVSIAASAKNSGFEVFWASEGRSPDTYKRAQDYGLEDAETIDKLCRICSIIISICPPHSAEDVADQVLSFNYRGIYLDANAISPQRAMRIASKMEARGITFVDGGIIGGPAWEPGTVLYLSGKHSPRIAGCFLKGPLQTTVIGEMAGKASALKMCYAAYTKGRAALLCAILGTAEGLGVRTDLTKQWSLEEPDFAKNTENMARRVTAKAWRFAGEMEEIAMTFESAGIPGGFHKAAAEIYRRMADFRDRQEIPELSEVLNSLLGG